AVHATEAGAGSSLYRADLLAPSLWLFGNEGQGLDASLRAWPAVSPNAIPQRPAVESLNVGVAAAVCLYEQLRQRIAAGVAESGSARLRHSICSICRIVAAISSIDLVVDDNQRMPSRRIIASASPT